MDDRSIGKPRKPSGMRAMTAQESRSPRYPILSPAWDSPERVDFQPTGPHPNRYPRIELSSKDENRVQRKHNFEISDVSNFAQAASSVDAWSPSSISAREEDHERLPSNIYSYGFSNRAQSYKTNRFQLLRDADKYQLHRIQVAARSVVERWCNAALAAQNHHEYLRRMAVAFDIEILMRQAFEHWRIRLHLRKQTVETDRFFERREERATRARNLYLLTKAFTHWTQSAIDEHHQRSKIREQVLGIKYFHAWRDITIAHQNRVESQQQRTALGFWKQRYIADLTNCYKADLQSCQSLLKNAYWRWFWTFCERRAPEWYARRLKHRQWLAWCRKYRHNSQKLSLVLSARNLESQRFHLHKWARTIRTRLAISEQAATLFRHRLTVRLCRKWQLEQQFWPLRTQISNIIDWRVASESFTLFKRRFKLERQSAVLDSNRILQVHWTIWNDHLRCQTLQNRILDRFVLEALYKWAILGRSFLLRRLLEYQLKTRYLRNWRACHMMKNAHHVGHIEKSQLQRAHSAKLRAFAKWNKQLKQQDRATQQASDFPVPRLAVNALQIWTSALHHYSELGAWVDHANYFFVARRYTKIWNKAATASKRQRRRIAYMQVRRQLKTKLATRTIRVWRVALSTVLDRDHQAATKYQQRLLHLGTEFFDIWTDAFRQQRSREREGERFHGSSMLKHCFQSWSNQVNILWEQLEMASEKAEFSTHKTFFICFRRFHLHVLEMKSQQGKADGLRLGYQKRHFHGLLRQWHDRTFERRQHSLAAINSAARSRKEGSQEVRPSGTQNDIEEWMEWDPQPWNLETRSFGYLDRLSGHLSTPSKRAVRAKGIVQSTTPLGTPFLSRSRPQVNATPRTARGSVFGRLRMGNDRMMGSKIEDRPKVGDVESNSLLDDNE